MATSYHHLLC
jgi:hypothetical protein